MGDDGHEALLHYQRFGNLIIKIETGDVNKAQADRTALVPASQTSQYADAAPLKINIAAEAEDNPTNKRNQTTARAAPDDGEKKDGDHCGRNEDTAFNRVGLDKCPYSEQEAEPDSDGLVVNAQEKTLKESREKRGGSGGWI